MCHCIFFGINPHVSKHHAFHLYRVTILFMAGSRLSSMDTPWRQRVSFGRRPPIDRDPPPLDRDPPLYRDPQPLDIDRPWK